MTKYDVSSSLLFPAPVPRATNKVRVDSSQGLKTAPTRSKAEWPFLPWLRGPLSATVISAL